MLAITGSLRLFRLTEGEAGLAEADAVALRRETKATSGAAPGRVGLKVAAAC